MDQLTANDTATPANELVSLAEIDDVISSIIASSRQALEWCVENGCIQQAAPLQTALDQLANRTMAASNDIGAAGFLLDEDNNCIYVSAPAINMIASVARSLSNLPKGTLFKDDLIARAIIALYIFHELTHISQKFTKHEHAQEIKDAFGKDFLAIMDTVTDVKAIHCASIVQCALMHKYDSIEYINNVRLFAVLSFRSVTDIFSVSGADHKKRRALGLLSTIAACDAALNCEPEHRIRAIITASSPLFAGYSILYKRIVCVRIDNAEIVYITNTSDNEYSAKEIWENIENIPLPSAVMFLRRHLEYSFSRKIA